MGTEGSIRLFLLLTCLCLMTAMVTAYESSAVQALKNSNPTKYDQYQTWMKEGEKLMSQSKSDEAAAKFILARVLVPGDPAALAAVGRAHVANREYTMADQDFNEAEAALKRDKSQNAIGDWEYYNFMTKLTTQRLESAKDQVLWGPGEEAAEKARQKVSQYEEELKEYEAERAEAETKSMIPGPLAGIVMGISGAAALFARQRLHHA
jgi:hypothetical protein